jgi:CBS domain-containing protein
MLHFLDFNNRVNMFSYYYSFLWLKDIATRVIAQEVSLEDTPVSKVMTKNPVFVLSDTLAVEALQKMVQGLRAHPILFSFYFFFFSFLVFEK